MRLRTVLAAVAVTAVATAANAQNTSTGTARGRASAAPPAPPGANFRFFPGVGAVPQGRFEAGSSFVFTPGTGFARAGDARSRLFQFVPGVGFVPRANTFDNQGDFVFVPGVGFVPSDPRQRAAFERRLNRFRLERDIGLLPADTVTVSGRPFVEAEVMQVSPASVVVRFVASGQARNATFPIGEVFLLQNGALVTAATLPGGLRPGLRVLVPGAAVRARTDRQTGR